MGTYTPNINIGERTLLGFDFGLKRIGVAVGQEYTQTASELTTITYKTNQLNWGRIEKLLDEWKPDALVIGLPVHMDGKEHALTKAARQFGVQLEQRFKLPVYEADERLSSYAAEEQLKQRNQFSQQNKHKVDKLAAQIILQDWLNQQENKRGDR